MDGLSLTNEWMSSGSFADPSLSGTILGAVYDSSELGLHICEEVISDLLWMVCMKSNSALYILISHLICQALLEECHANDKSYGL